MDGVSIERARGRILFVDENVIEINPFRRLLEARGHVVEQHFSADKAFLSLINGGNHDLIIVDIMLAPGINKSERFSSGNTERRMQAGITLVRALIAEGCPIPADRFVLFTHVERTPTLQAANLLQQQHGVAVWQKIDFVHEPAEFVTHVENRIAAARAAIGGDE